MKVEKSSHIHCTPEKAFAFATDFANASKWMDGFIEYKTLTEGATHVGTQYIVVSQLFGQKIEMKSEVTVWEPPTRYEYKNVDAPAALRGGYTFTAQGGGTLVSVWGEGEFSGLFKLAEGLMKGKMDKQMDETLSALKKALEG